MGLAARVMDAIIKGLETRGYDVRLKEQLAEGQIHGESLRFGLSEDLETQKREQEDDTPTGRKLRRDQTAPKALQIGEAFRCPGLDRRRKAGEPAASP